MTNQRIRRLHFKLNQIRESGRWKLIQLQVNATAFVQRIISMIGLNVKGANRKLAREIEASGFFDRDWYIKKYKDVTASGIEPAYHYIVQGANEGRDPGPDFCTIFYTGQNEDVSNSGSNPLIHYLHSADDKISEIAAAPEAPDP